ncbi:hydroxymethylglutaryl-CoA lyase [Virgibacillus salexigens]|uniref:Hydroxymethylglutaryl-CoA lyase n=1 Tax=Virgibacillus kapii TaxID=1638645 RepID=A0ABQ2DIM9_9BACI|nr:MULTISPECIES: hydroxymethylglutaryl-CoA lyase [Virgibacillus]MYL40428.1 hydroxymethylglutaryl-CoA lyase [Virgibacillus massiliensis]GGJ58999.1 hydroxymethylglutaryl-CoA lyase [Virgibacillus kapii]
MSKQIYIHEVVTRDGLQNEDQFLPTKDKIHLLNQLSQTGLDKIEVTSFVSPNAVPNLADAEQVMTSIQRNPQISYSALIPNVIGAKRAMKCHVDEVNLVVSASETHNQKNIRQSIQQTYDQFELIIDYLSDKPVIRNGSIGTAFGCPFEGKVSEFKVFLLIEAYKSLGIENITLADTTGMATPTQVYQLCKQVLTFFPDLQLTMHFHNTRGMGLANVIQAIQAGVTHFDSSLGGIGGCPFAPGATGNICTEDVVHMLYFMGYDLNAKLDSLIDSSIHLQSLLSHETPGQVSKAGKITDLHDPSKF